MSGDWSIEPDAMSYGIAINAYAKVRESYHHFMTSSLFHCLLQAYNVFSLCVSSWPAQYVQLKQDVSSVLD
jgi:hypothetical protein